MIAQLRQQATTQLLTASILKTLKALLLETVPRRLKTIRIQTLLQRKMLMAQPQAQLLKMERIQRVRLKMEQQVKMLILKTIML